MIIGLPVKRQSNIKMIPLFTCLVYLIFLLTMEINFQYIFITAPINLVPFTDDCFLNNYSLLPFRLSIISTFFTWRRRSHREPK